MLIGGLGFPWSLSLLFHNAIFGEVTEKITSVNIIFGMSFETFTIGNLISERGYFIHMIILNDEWLFDFSSFYILLLVIYSILTILIIHFVNINIKTVELETSTRGKFETIFTFGIIFIVVAILVDETITTTLGIFLFVIGLVGLLFSIINLFTHILGHPYSTIYLRKNVSTLFNKNQVSWVALAIREQGPEIQKQSADLKTHPDINQSEVFKFGVQTLMMAYNENKYIENVSISPFAARRDYFALSVSFICKDPTLKDHRFSDKLQSALIIILPKSLFASFTKPLKNLHKIILIIEENNLRDKLYSEIFQQIYLEELSEKFLNSLF